METIETKKHKKIYMLVNIALITFLIIAATIGVRGLSASNMGQASTYEEASPAKNNVMVCAIGQCLFI